MVKQKARHRHESVTEAIPVLVPADMDLEGHVLFLKGRPISFQPVKRFVYEKEPRSKRASAIQQMCALAKGKRVDYFLLDEGFPGLVEDVGYEKLLTEAILTEARKNPPFWSRRYLPAIFNRQIRSTALVMWWPEDQPEFGPAIYCPKPETALFVSLLLRKIRICLGCGELFKPHRKDQEYHDYRCAHAHRTQRWRHRKEKGEDLNGNR